MIDYAMINVRRQGMFIINNDTTEMIAQVKPTIL